MLVGELANLATRVLAGVRRGQRIPVVVDRAPGPRPGCPASAPDVEITPGAATVDVTCNVPGATPENVLVCWDDECSLLCIRVARRATRGTPHDWYVEVRLPPTVDGANSKCTLRGTRLRVSAPLEDTPASTALAIRTFFEQTAAAPALLVPIL